MLGLLPTDSRYIAKARDGRLGQLVGLLVVPGRELSRVLLLLHKSTFGLPAVGRHRWCFATATAVVARNRAAHGVAAFRLRFRACVCVTTPSSLHDTNEQYSSMASVVVSVCLFA